MRAERNVVNRHVNVGGKHRDEERDQPPRRQPSQPRNRESDAAGDLADTAHEDQPSRRRKHRWDHSNERLRVSEVQSPDDDHPGSEEVRCDANASGHVSGRRWFIGGGQYPSVRFGGQRARRASTLRLRGSRTLRCATMAGRQRSHSGARFRRVAGDIARIASVTIGVLGSATHPLQIRKSALPRLLSRLYSSCMATRVTHREGALSGRVLVRVADFVAARGFDAEALCRSAGLTLETLRDPQSRVPYAVAERLGERAAEWTDDANFGLHLAQDVRNTQAYDAGALMLMASPSIRAALENLARYQRYWGDGQRCTLARARGGMRVRYALRGSDAVSKRHTDECALAEIVIGVRFLGAPDLSPRAVRFRHASPADTREHLALFRCPVTFSASDTEVEFDDATLDTPMANANAAFVAIFQQQVERALASLPGESGLATDVRSAARAALAGGACTLAGTARVLSVSARTMQRRLSDEGTSFAAIVDALRREMALAHLDRGVSVAEIAWLLGYADPSAFHHAFKRWTGKSPEDARSARAVAQS